MKKLFIFSIVGLMLFFSVVSASINYRHDGIAKLGIGEHQTAVFHDLNITGEVFMENNLSVGDLDAISLVVSGNATANYFIGDGSTLINVNETDPIFLSSDAYWITATDRANWDLAYGWGDHAGLYDASGTAVGLMVFHLSTFNHANYDTAYSWGDHSTIGYLTSYTETDPVFIAWDKSTGIVITESQISDLTHTPVFDGNITEIYNSLGDLKIQPGVQGDVVFFVDTGTIDSNGNAWFEGVLSTGGSIPNSRLSIQGSESSAHANNAGIAMENTATGGDTWYLRVGANGTTTPKGGFSIADTSAYRFVIDEDGNVGIGTIAPGLPLEVRSADDNQAIFFDSTTQAQGVGGGIAFGGKYNDAGGEAMAGRIGVSKTNGISGDVAFNMIFETQDSEGSITQRMILTSKGNLEIDTTTGALLISRMTTTQRNNLTAVNGMIIYNSQTNAFNFYENESWVTK